MPYNDPDPYKDRARKLLHNAVYRGKIKKPKHCKHCGREENLQGHHNDYSKPLVVLWLCAKCHAILHKEYNRQHGIKQKPHFSIHSFRPGISAKNS